MGGACLLFLEEGLAETLLRGARGIAWLLRIDHHGVFHGGRHPREYRLKIVSLEEPGELMWGGQRER